MADLTVEQRLQLVIGGQAFENAVLMVNLEQAQKKIAELEGKLKDAPRQEIMPPDPLALRQKTMEEARRNGGGSKG